MAFTGDPFESAKKHRSGFMSFLDWLGSTEQMGLNAVRGNLGAVGRHAADFLSGPIRALIPGDQSNWEMSRPEDNTSVSEMAGIDRKEHPLGAMAADMAGMALDPAFYLDFPAAIAKKLALKAGAEAASAVAKTAEGASTAEKVAAAAQATTDAGNASAAAKAAASGANGGIRLRVPFTKMASPAIFEGQALDPLSLAGTALSKGVGLLPEGAQRKVAQGVQGIRSSLGWLKAAPAIDAAIQKGAATGHQTGTANASEIAKAMQGVGDQAANDVFSLRGDVIKGADGKWMPLGVPAPQPFLTAEEQAQLHAQRAAATGWDTERQAAAVDAANKADQRWRSMWAEGIKDRRIFNPPSMYTNAAGKMTPVDELKALHEAIPEASRPDFASFLQDSGHTLTPLDAATHAPADYMPGVYNKAPTSLDDELEAATGSALKGKTIRNGDLRAEYLNGDGITPITDARELLMRSAHSMGSLAKKARIAEELGGQQFGSLVDSGSRTGIKDFITSLKGTDLDSHQVLDAAFNGMPAQKGIEKAVAYFNKWFKQSAVAGAVIPKVASATRNTIGHPIQRFMTPEAGGPAGGLDQLLASPQTFLNGMRAAAEKYAGRPIAGDSIMNGINQMKAALEGAGGRRSAALQGLRDAGRHDLAEALDNNVIDAGFVHADSSPDLLRDGILALSGKVFGEKGVDRVKRALEAPGAMFNGSESYARTKLFLDHLKQATEAGVPLKQAAEEAGAAQRAAYYDYGTQTAAHRAAKTVIPFGGFQFNALKQQAKGLSRNPYLADVLNPLYGQSDTGPVPPFVAEQMRFPLGKGPDGNDHYLSGFAQPIEALSDIPNVTGDNLHGISRDIERSLVASSAPVLKSAYGLVTNKDPFFDTPYGSYDRVPLLGSEGVPGRVYNAVAGTGLIQPIDSILHAIERASDPRKSAAENAIGSLTGAHVLSVDPMQAKIQNLQEELAGDVNAHPVNDFYSKDPETMKVLREYRQAKQARQKANKKAPPKKP